MSGISGGFGVGGGISGPGLGGVGGGREQRRGLGIDGVPPRGPGRLKPERPRVFGELDPVRFGPALPTWFFSNTGDQGSTNRVQAFDFDEPPEPNCIFEGSLSGRLSGSMPALTMDWRR